MFANPDLEFNEKYVDISNGRSSVRYFYSDPSLLTVAPKELKIPQEIISFDINENTLNEMLKAANILQVNNLRIVGKNGSLLVEIDDDSNYTSNSFSVILDENYSGPDYSGMIKVSEIKFLPGSYKVYLTKTIISKFVHESGNLMYVVSTKKD